MYEFTKIAQIFMDQQVRSSLESVLRLAGSGCGCRSGKMISIRPDPQLLWILKSVWSLQVRGPPARVDQAADKRWGVLLTAVGHAHSSPAHQRSSHTTNFFHVFLWAESRNSVCGSGLRRIQASRIENFPCHKKNTRNFLQQKIWDFFIFAIEINNY